MSVLENLKEVYKSTINIHKQTGQGLSSIVCVKSSMYKNSLEQLQEMGLVIKERVMNTSIGHPESNFFWFPTKGYRPTKDKYFEDDFDTSLFYIRKYLGISKESDILRAISCNVLSDDKYKEWLEVNIDDINVMLSLDVSDISEGNILNLYSKHIDVIKSSLPYEKNYSIDKSISYFREKSDISSQLIDQYNMLLRIGTRVYDGYDINDLVKEDKLVIKECDDILNLLQSITYDKNTNIKEVLGSI